MYDPYLARKVRLHPSRLTKIMNDIGPDGNIQSSSISLSESFPDLNYRMGKTTCRKQLSKTYPVSPQITCLPKMKTGAA